jgi:hypothetical protein
VTAVIPNIVLELLFWNAISSTLRFSLLRLNIEVAQGYRMISVVEARQAALHLRIWIHHWVVFASSGRSPEDVDVEDESKKCGYAINAVSFLSDGKRGDS